MSDNQNIDTTTNINETDTNKPVQIIRMITRKSATSAAARRARRER